MSKIVVSQAKFDEACQLYGYDSVWSILVVKGECLHDWLLCTSVTKNTSGTLVCANAYLECQDCGVSKVRLDLLD